MRPQNPSDKLQYFQNLSPEEKLKHLVYFAVFAPSSHNTQPWLFKIIGNSIEVFANKKRELPESDSTKRQMFLSIGAAIENILLAAKSYGLKPEIEYLSGDRVAKIYFFSIAPNPEQYNQITIQAILSRQSNRYNFENQKPPESFFENARAIAQAQSTDLKIVTDPSQLKKIQEVVLQSIVDAFKDKKFTRELSHWIKPSLNKYKDGMTGYSMDIPYPMSFVVPLLVRHFDVSKMQKNMHQPWLENAPAYILISSEQDQQQNWIRAGQAFEQIAVLAESENIKIGVFGAPIEIGEHHHKLKELFGASGRPLMFFRVGYTSKVSKKSPRLSLEEVLIK